ncbi:MAG: hypothetical protein AAGI38_17215 [Bacteroidota bacterium]
MKQLITLAVALLLVGSLAAQTAQNRGDNSLTVYQVCFAGFDEPVDPDQFYELKRFGFIRTQSISPATRDKEDGMFRLYLGPYIGLEAAEMAMAFVRAKGYTDAYLESDPYQLTSEDGKKLTHTVQVGAFDKPDMEAYQLITREIGKEVYLIYEDGLFKIFAGLYTAEEIPQVKTETIWYLSEQGFETFIRSFR